MHYGFFSPEQLASSPKRSISLVPQCSACRLYRGCTSKKMPVGGDGKSSILIVGDAPSGSDDDRRQHFSDANGALLELTLTKHGVNLRRDCWLTNSIICHPRSDRKPTSDEIGWCRPSLVNVIQELKPEKIILLGPSAVASAIPWLWKNEVGLPSRWDGWRIPSRKINAWICPTWGLSDLTATAYGKSSKDNPVRQVIFERHVKAAMELKGRPWDKVPDPDKQIRIELDDRRAADAVREMTAKGRTMAFDYETTGLKPDNGKVRIHCCSVSDGVTSVAFPWQGKAIEAVREFLKSPVPKVGANVKFEARFTRAELGFWPRGWLWDLVLMAHVMDNRAGICSVKFQSFVRQGTDAWDEEIGPYLKAKRANDENTIRQFPLAKVLKYCALDSLHEWDTSASQAAEFGVSREEFAAGDLNRARKKTFVLGLPDFRAYELFHEGVSALAKVEANGMRIDTDYLERIMGWIDRKVKKINDGLRRHPVFERWRRAFGPKTNLGSDPQLAHVIYKVHGCQVKEWTEKTKNLPLDKRKPAADRQSIQRAIDGMDSKPRRAVRGFFRRLDQMESLKKLKSTHLKGVMNEVVNGFIHPFFNLTTSIKDDSKGGAKSYRGSADSPPVQQLPVRDPNMGRLIRRCFIPRDGNHFVELDFSGHEFKIASCVWKDKAMMAYAADPLKDVHRDMAAKIFGIIAERVAECKPLRYIAKNQFTFPVLYGSYYVQMAQRIWAVITKGQMRFDDGTLVLDHLKSLGITRLGACDPNQEPVPGTFEHQVRQIEKWFMSKFPKFARDKDKWYEDYRKNAGFHLVTGFWIGGLYSKNFTLNGKIQGPAFHCLLWALIELQKELKRKGMRALITCNIHDSIIADVPEEEIQEFLTLAKEIMTVRIRKAWDWVSVLLDCEAQVSPLNQAWHYKEFWECHDGIWGPKKKVAA